MRELGKCYVLHDCTKGDDSVIESKMEDLLWAHPEALLKEQLTPFERSLAADAPRAQG